MFTQYQLSPVQLSEAALAAARTLATIHPGAAPGDFAASNMAQRLRDKPATYLQFGPYWWAVKQALRAHGFDFGPADDDLVRQAYGGGLPAYTAMVAGEQFREHYNATFLQGASQFWLDDQAEESYVLFDQDMEARKLGPQGLRVAFELEPAVAVEVQEGAAAPVLDSAQAGVAPFAVSFDHGMDVWKAHVSAQDGESAYQAVKTLKEGGVIGRAIDGGLLDSAVVHVDHEARAIVLGARA